MRHTLTAALIMLSSIAANAQEKKHSKSVSLNLGSGPMVQIDKDANSKDGTKKDESAFKIGWGMLDIGINSLVDNSDYNSAATKGFLQVPSAVQNENLFSLKQGKSINVNIWPMTARYRVQKSANQKIYISSGIGLQMYNFRFSKNISYLNDINPVVIMDSVSFSKNKLAITYLSVPLMATFKTRLADKAWAVYGVGLMGGYRISSWTKQISGPRGKDKNHDDFNLNDFNVCLTGELGLDGYFRLYASYQITPLHDTFLDQHPLSIGIRFGGI